MTRVLAPSPASARPSVCAPPPRRLCLLLLLLMLVSLQGAMAQYPGACVLPGGRGLLRTCCPTEPHTQLPCGGPRRGRCAPADSAGYASAALLDGPAEAQARWRPFERVCSCHAGFFGAACEFCEAGYAGPNCTRRELRECRDFFTELAEDERQVGGGGRSRPEAAATADSAAICHGWLTLTHCGCLRRRTSRPWSG